MRLRQRRFAHESPHGVSCRNGLKARYARAIGRLSRLLRTAQGSMGPERRTAYG
jgi:hypothetical protein